jgi:ATP-dependent exoDNAse (exonuclease V) alpha subunit
MDISIKCIELKAKYCVNNHSKTLQPKTRSQFYVAITRAKYSVGIVFDYNEKTNIEDVEKYRQNISTNNLVRKVEH